MRGIVLTNLHTLYAASGIGGDWARGMQFHFQQNPVPFRALLHRTSSFV